MPDRLVKDIAKTEPSKFDHGMFDEKRKASHLCYNG